MISTLSVIPGLKIVNSPNRIATAPRSAIHPQLRVSIPTMIPRPLQLATSSSSF
jgi:hypothetical protein